jgi:hypothetical protein
VHSVVGTPANVSDISQAAKLLHGEEEVALGDAGYIGAEKREELQDRPVSWIVTASRKALQALPEGAVRDNLLHSEKANARVRAIVEHPNHVVTNLFKYRKVRYHGLAKNGAQLFSLANLVLAIRLLPGPGISSPRTRKWARLPAKPAHRSRLATTFDPSLMNIFPTKLACGPTQHQLGIDQRFLKNFLPSIFSYWTPYPFLTPTTSHHSHYGNT